MMDWSLVLIEYISIAAVTAAYGSALTAGHFFQAPKNNQKGFAPPLGASPRLGIHAEVPAAQHLRSAIVVNGAPEIKIKSEAA